MNKEYIEKLLKEQREMCCQYLKDEFSLSERICESLKYAPSPVIDLSGVTNDGMPALPDGLNDDSNVDYNFKVGWIACWKAFTQSGQQAPEPVEEKKLEIVCYCGSLRVAIDAFKKAEYEAVVKGEIALLPCCMFVDIQREYGAESDYKIKADEVHKRKIDICDKVMVLNVGGYIGESTRSEINYAISIGKPVEYLEP
jgi:hypothetical protein